MSKARNLEVAFPCLRFHGSDMNFLSSCTNRCFFFTAERLGEKYTENLEDIQDPLLESLTVLELNCGLARNCCKHARTALTRLFGHFFPTKTAPDKVEPLLKAFSGKEDPIRGYR